MLWLIGVAIQYESHNGLVIGLNQGAILSDAYFFVPHKVVVYK